MSGPAPQYCGRLGTAGSGDVEYLAEGNSDAGHEVGAEPRDWFDDAQAAGREFLQHATRVKNVWVPYGV